MTEQEKAKDKRLRKQYGWTLEMYNALGEFQGWRCAGCGRLSKTAPLNVDHKHFHVEAERVGPNRIPEYAFSTAKWYASVHEFPDIEVWGMTRKAVEQEARKAALPRSVRGLLCAGRYAGCNRKLGRIDNPVWLRRILAYLENPPAEQIQKVYQK